MRRIGITQRVEVIPHHGERRDCLDQRWAALLEAAGFFPIPLPSGIRDVPAYVERLELHGVILSGGNDLAGVDPGRAVPERDRLEAALLDHCGRERIPVLGVCRGMQFMATHHGGTVDPVVSHVATRHALEVEPSGLPLGRRERGVNSYHNHGIRDEGCPSSFRAAARTEDGSIEAIANRELRQYGIMWHPERESPWDPEDLALLHFVFDTTGGV